ncbi:MAG: hypothetical protein HON98_02675 [Chloroflexi bacterium]|nr:hypothetical protein [Chloroflexota bacterium]MBT3668747.1 hypothetical protein [Chloroflexota bacterium]MBT4001907.1 hypothetical protein [Chloroflexota bacterium]MBT4305448.1 hypothetical protein [Chloroflexota bacterium]MBT4533059.1 hypothetical protein [Chloroflexota bacterium]
MKNIQNPNKRAISDLVFAYRHIHGHSERPLSYRDFARECNQALKDTRHEITYQSVKNWEDRVHIPRMSFLIPLAFSVKDWRSEFALDAIAILRPKLYKPATYIGERAMDRSKLDTGPLKARYDPYFIPHS